MENSEIYAYVDHTALKPFTTWEEIVKLCDEAVEHQTASVCIPSCYVAAVRRTYPKLSICTVVGFRWDTPIRRQK